MKLFQMEFFCKNILIKEHIKTFRVTTKNKSAIHVQIVETPNCNLSR